MFLKSSLFSKKCIPCGSVTVLLAQASKESKKKSYFCDNENI